MRVKIWAALIFVPLAKTLGFDLTWFGLLLFVMKGVAPPGISMRDIYLAAMPFIACVLLLILIIIFYPPIATWLPRISH